MRTLLLPAAVLFFFGNAAFATPAYDKIVDKYCGNRKDFVSGEGAKKAAAAVTAGKMTAEDYLEVWELSCHEKTAFDAAVDAKRGRLNLAAFRQVAHMPCLRGTKLTHAGALEVGREAAKNTLDVATFARLWKDACEFGPSLAAAKAVKNGSLDEKSFHDYYSVLFDHCIGLANGKGAEAQQVGLGVQHGTINRQAFFRALEKSCKFETALGAAERKMNRAPAFLDAPVAEEGNGAAD